MNEEPILIRLKRKYRVHKAGRAGPYQTRTGTRKRPGYHKHRFQGMNVRPYARVSGH